MPRNMMSTQPPVPRGVESNGVFVGPRRATGAMMCAGVLLLLTACPRNTDDSSTSSSSGSSSSGGSGDGGQTCTPGQLDCACTATGTCDGNLVCMTGVCKTPGGQRGLTVETAAARACELLFKQNGATLVSATYGGDTHGVLRRQDPNVALAVSRGSDTPFDANSIQIVVDGDAANLQLRTTRCFDSAGAEIANAVVTLR